MASRLSATSSATEEGGRSLRVDDQTGGPHTTQT
jgi:hypothetical protein